MIDSSSSDDDDKLEEAPSSTSSAERAQMPTSPSHFLGFLTPQPSFDTQSIHSGRSGYETYALTPRSPRGTSPSTDSFKRLSGAFLLPSQPYPDSGPTIDSEEEERRSLLQLFVLVARCIAYPFATKQNADKVPIHGVRATVETLQQQRERFEAFLEGRTRLGGSVDVAVQEAMRIYYETVLTNQDVAGLIQAGGWKMDDFSGVFSALLPRMLANLELDKETQSRVTTVWLQRFHAISRGDTGLSRQDASSSSIHSSFSSLTPSAEMLLTAEQLYEVFQGVLGVKRFEHQILFNQCQLGNKDEQASLLRRELHCREEVAETILPTSVEHLFVNRQMVTMHVREEQAEVKRLLHVLDSMPVTTKMGTLGTLGRGLRSPRVLSRHRDLDNYTSKSDIVMPFNVEVLVMEVRGLKSLGLSMKKIVYAVMKVDGCHEKMMTNKMEAEDPVWETQGDFATTVPRPHVRIELFAESSGFLELEDKRLGKLTLLPTSVHPVPLNWYSVECQGHGGKNALVEIRALVKIDRPDVLKKCGFVYVKGTNCWRKLKSRYLMLVQMTAFSFALCSYEERQSTPKTMIVVEGYTVDYCEPQYLGGSEDGNKYSYQFVAEKEGDHILFGCQDERERESWVMALYRATGQQHKPEPVLRQSSGQSGSHRHTESVVQRIGLDDFLQANVSKFDHKTLFAKLQKMTLNYRLNEGTTNLGWFSPGQTFVLEEYCSRYGVRPAFRYLCLLQEQLNRAKCGTMIDPGLMHYCYTYIESHLRGLKPDGHIGSVLQKEKEWFEGLQEELQTVALKNLRNFRACFPFGRPENALQSTLALVEKVVVTDTSSHAMLADLREEVRSCMKTAALTCYNSISAQAAHKLAEWMVQERNHRAGSEEDGVEGEEGVVQVNVDMQSVDYVVIMAQLGIEVCQEIDDFHGKAFKRFKGALQFCIETVWELFYSDMKPAVDAQSLYDSDVFRLFFRLNSFLLSHEMLSNGKFHKQLLGLFMFRTVYYLDRVEMEMMAQLGRDVAIETWDPAQDRRSSVAALENLLQRLESVQTFLSHLQWPEPDFRQHLESRRRRLAADGMEAFAKRTQRLFISSCEKGGSGSDFHYVVPAPLCVMLNAIYTLQHRLNDCCGSTADFSVQSLYRDDISDVLLQIRENMSAKLIIKLTDSLESLMSRLARYDPKSFLSSLRSLTGPKLDAIAPFVQYVSQNLTEMDNLLFVDRQQFMLAWHNVMCKKILDFVTKRPGSLVQQQLSFIAELLEQLLQCFLGYGFEEEDLKSQFYTMVQSRVQYELSAGDLLKTSASERLDSESL